MPNYIPTSGRGTFKAKIALPKGAVKPLAVLSVSGYDFQANEVDTKALQYWADVSGTGDVEIPRVKAGVYRLTVYAEGEFNGSCRYAMQRAHFLVGIFGQYVQDNITVKTGTNSVVKATWTEESAGESIPLVRCAFR